MIFLIIALLSIGSLYLVYSYIHSSIFSRNDFGTVEFPASECVRYIINKDGTKLAADFYINKSIQKFAVLYYGYGCNFSLICRLKQFYIENNYNVVLICSNGFYKSDGKKKPSDTLLKSDLELWIEALIQMFGNNIKITLHGFSSTALSCLMVNTNKIPAVKNIISDSAHLFPVYLFSNIKNKSLQIFFRKKSRVKLPEIKVNSLIISNCSLAKDAYKLYDLSPHKSSLYIFDSLNINEYITKLSAFLSTHQEQPEEST